MSEALLIFINPIKFLFIVFVFLSFASCKGRQPNKKVGPGEAQYQKTFFRKYCSEGSIEIFKKTSSESASVSRLDQMNPGDKVSIKGVVANASICSPGSLSFTCEAQVKIGGVFVCESGSISSQNSLTYGAGYSRQTQYQGYGSSFTGSKTFRGGGIIVYDNGTKVSVSVSINNPSAYCPHCHCPLNFICR